jgi:hypothetical protein
MTRSIAIMIAALIVAAISSAQAQRETRSMVSPSGLSCGKWTDTLKRPYEHEVYKGWVLGYLSGVNSESTGTDFMQGRDAEGLTAWIDDYCRRNPLQDVTRAVYALTDELRSGR